MNFFSRENPDRWYQLAWLLCVITLPWIDKANNVSLIFLTCLWIMDGSIIKRWHLLKSDRWVWPFFLYFILLVVGMVYSPDIDKAIFTLEKKITFIVLPLIAITGRQLSPKFIGFLKLSFVYSCVFMILLNLGATAVYFFLGDLAFNFDPNSQAVFSSMHPEASPIWMHFSYIHLLQWSGLHPAYFSMYLVFGMVILFNEEYSSSTQRNIHILLGFIMSCFIALLSTRIAIIAFVACALYMGAKRIMEKRVTAAFLVLAVGFVLGLLVWLNPVARFRVIEEPVKTSYRVNQETTNFNSVNYRLLEWQGSWSIIRANFFSGVGTGGGISAMSNFYANYSKETAGLEYDPHNQYLQTWLELGLAGLFALLLCIFAPLFRPNVEQSYVAFILIFSLMCLTESIGERQKGIVFFTLFQSLFLAFEKKST